MRHFGLFIVLASVFFGSAVLQATPVLYVNDSANHLLKVDVVTGETSLVGTMSAQFTDIAFSPSGQLYGVTSNYLYEIDPANGWSRLIGAVGFGVPGNARAIDSLTFGPDGILYAAGDDTLITINTSTGQGTRLGGLSGQKSAGDLAIDSLGRLLLTTDSGKLVKVNTSGTGTEVIGSLPYTDVYAVAGTSDGELYGIRGNNQIVAINPVTGQAAVTATMHANVLIGWAWGASVPSLVYTPEPSTLLLLLGPALLGLHRSRKKLH